MASVTSYAQWHIKRNATTGESALRTHFADAEELGRYAWLVCHAVSGVRHATTAEVAGWDDLYTPEVSE